VEYAVRHPERVSHLIMLGAFARGYAKRGTGGAETREAMLTLMREGWGRDNPAFRQMWTSLFVPDGTLEHMRWFNELQRMTTSPENAVRLISADKDVDVRSLLPRLHVPTLILHAKDDAVCSFSQGRELATLIPGARFVVLESKNHLLLEDEPAFRVFLTEVRRFLGTERGEDRAPWPESHPTPAAASGTRAGDPTAAAASGAPPRAPVEVSRAEAALAPGRRLGHYEIVSRIGAGGMGEVYRSRDTKLRREVAIKVLTTPLAIADRGHQLVLHEARNAAALNHPNICTIHEVGDADGRDFIVMEYVTGQPLNERVPKGGLAVETVLRYGVQVADGLAHAHGRSIIHRDLKGANIVVTPEGRAKILDFGIAAHVPVVDIEAATRSQVSLTDAGTVAGTLPYMAPEVLRGEPADARSDIWSLGVLLYELTTGDLPFGGVTGFELTSAILRDPPKPWPSRVPAELRAVLDRCLAKEPGQRYQRASEVRVALETLQAGTKPMATRRQPRRSASATRRRARSREIRSLAVLPLENLSRDPEQEYFVDGMTEALIADLAQIQALRVISRTSAMHYKGTRKPLPEIARELNVDAIVEGSVLQAGDQVRIRAQLIHARTDTHLWAKSYARSLSQVLTLQGEVARAIAFEVEAQLTETEQSRLRHARVVTPEAHQAYLRGRHYLNQFTDESVRKAVAAFEEAVRREPEYGAAYAGLAESFVWLSAGLGIFQERDNVSHARRAAERALELDPSAAEAYASMGLIATYHEWDCVAAAENFRRAIKTRPNYAAAHLWRAWAMACLERKYQDALSAFEAAEAFDPLALAVKIQRGFVRFFMHDFDGAVIDFEKAIELHPQFPLAHYGLGAVSAMAGRLDDAVARAQRAIELEGRQLNHVWLLGHAHALAGERNKVMELLSEMLGRSQQGYVASSWIARLYASLGDNDRVFEWLDRAVEERDPALIYATGEPHFDAARKDARFNSLLKRMGLRHLVS